MVNLNEDDFTFLVHKNANQLLPFVKCHSKNSIGWVQHYSFCSHGVTNECFYGYCSEDVRVIFSLEVCTNVYSQRV